ncbi:MAG: hypothetical protein ACOX6M_00095 [Armatimonadota bacterium]
MSLDSARNDGGADSRPPRPWASRSARPGSAPGAIEFDWVRIESADGRVHREWDFER